MKSFLDLKSVDEVEKIIFDLPMLGDEEVGIEEAAGKRLARPFYAPANLPGFSRSTMDGYAVKASDTFGATENNPALLRVAGRGKMGKIPDLALGDGEAWEIFTGGALPEASDAVAMIEHCRDVGNGYIEITRALAPGMNMIEEDEDAREGQELLPAGKLVRAQETGILAAFGISRLKVIRSARVAIISTGDEIIETCAIPEPGQIRDVNSWSLQTLCREAGCETLRLGVIPDDRSALERILRKASEISDVIVVSGGSSAGMRDHTIEAFESLEESRIIVHGVAISPGKPFILGRTGKKCLIGLPGHVTSALVCAHVFLIPLLQHLQGLIAPQLKSWIDAKLSRSVVSAQGRQDYIRCKLEKKGDEYIAIPIIASSAVLTSLLEADGYVVCPENSEGLFKDQQVRFFPLQY